MPSFKAVIKTVCLLTCCALLLCACGEGSQSGKQPDAVSQTESRAEEVSAPAPEASAVGSAEISEDPAEEISEESSEEVSYDPETPFVPVIRFAVASDLHISYTSDSSAKRFEKLFKTAYAYAGSDPEYSSLDAVVLVGDLTNYGRANEFTALNSVISRCKKDETQILSVMGNHELHEGGAPVYLENMDDSLNKHFVINGIHFIGISPDHENGFSASSIIYLRDELEKAASESGPDTPIIVFRHHHIKDTVYVSSEWYADTSSVIKKILEKYPQVIDFSGHSHGPVNNPTSIWQGGFTALGTGTLSYFEMTSGMSYGTIPPNADRAAQYYIVEISADDRVKIMPFDILTEDFFKTPSNTDDPDEQIVYYIDSKKDPSLFRYKDREKSADIPYFASDAEIKLDSITENGAKLTIPQAYDGECIYCYRVSCAPVGGGNTKEFAFFSEYYFEPMPQTLSYTLSGLEDGTEYEISVYPEDCYGVKGEPIIARFTTVKAKEAVYESSVPVNFYGTFTNFDSVSSLTRTIGNLAYGSNVTGDIFAGDWQSGSSSNYAQFELSPSCGYGGSACLAVWSENADNRGLYILARAQNKFSTSFPDISYLRVWVDFSDVEFRKANFGLVAENGTLFTTDEEDYRNDQYFWYLPEGGTEWIRLTHGNDGCFGVEQGTPVNGYKGWLAFPVSDFKYRSGTGSGTESVNSSFHSKTVKGVYMFWDYADGGKYTGNKFYIDEISIVSDYTVFEPYNG